MCHVRTLDNNAPYRHLYSGFARPRLGDHACYRKVQRMFDPFVLEP